MKKEYKKVVITVGDDDPDFPGYLHQDYYIMSNFSSDQIEKAFKKGAKKIGVDISTLCNDSDHCLFKQTHANIFQNIGFQFRDWDNDWDSKKYGSEQSLSADDYFSLYLFTAKVGDQKFDYEEDNSRTDSLSIGGSGCFSP